MGKVRLLSEVMMGKRTFPHSLKSWTRWFFKRERTDRQFVELVILLYDFGVSLRKVERVLGWIGVKPSDVAIWGWIQKFGRRLGEAGRSALVLQKGYGDCVGWRSHG